MTARILFGLFVFTGAACGLSAIMSCASSPDPTRYTAVLAPDKQTFHDSVDAYIEKQCGTLDCHGQPGRGFRVYGFRGLRLYSAEAGLVPGVQTTTEDEIAANYYAIISVEPEEMSRVVARNGDNANQLLFLRKALNYERHKGGAVMSFGSDPYNCIIAWLSLPPNQGATLDPKGQAYCDNAKTLP
jgi:hypothetical protein